MSIEYTQKKMRGESKCFTTKNQPNIKQDSNAGNEDKNL